MGTPTATGPERFSCGGGGGPHSQVIKEFGLHSKDCMAPKEGLVPAEVCSDEGCRELPGPERVDGRTGLGGRGMVRCPTRGPGLEEGPCGREEVGLSILGLAPHLGGGISGPVPHPPLPLAPG